MPTVDEPPRRAPHRTAWCAGAALGWPATGAARTAPDAAATGLPGVQAIALMLLGALPLARQTVGLSQLAGYVVDDPWRQAPERCIDVRIAPGLLTTGDPTLLRVVLENLLGNAWKCSAQRPLARIEIGRSAFCMADNGSGFDMRFADRLFGVFQRLHSSSDFPGTGVGLAPVRHIVQRHGGDIWAAAEVDHGARFYFTLPA